jgi:hypothetical protein
LLNFDDKVPPDPWEVTVTFEGIEVTVTYSLWQLCQSSMDDIQGLECGEIAPRPGALHSNRVIEKVAGESQMEVVGAESVVG